MSDNNNEQATIVAGCKQLVIEVQPGYTLPQVVGLLNQRNALVSGESVIAYSETNADGIWVLAKVLSDNGGAAKGDWSVYTGQTEPGCGDCTCSVNPTQRDRNLAQIIRERADELTAEGTFTLAEALLIAERALLHYIATR